MTIKMAHIQEEIDILTQKIEFNKKLIERKNTNTYATITNTCRNRTTYRTVPTTNDVPTSVITDWKSGLKQNSINTRRRRTFLKYYPNEEWNGRDKEKVNRSEVKILEEIENKQDIVETPPSVLNEYFNDRKLNATDTNDLFVDNTDTIIEVVDNVVYPDPKSRIFDYKHLEL
eukprot:Awhi_evm3s11624